MIAGSMYLHTQSTDGGMITKPKGPPPPSSNVTKPTSTPATKNTSSNKNDEIKIRENKTKPNVHDPKKRLMVEEAKGKVLYEDVRHCEWSA